MSYDTQQSLNVTILDTSTVSAIPLSVIHKQQTLKVDLFFDPMAKVRLCLLDSSQSWPQSAGVQKKIFKSGGLPRPLFKV
jgi:hypothetical protein